MKFYLFILSILFLTILVEVNSKRLSDALQNRISGFKTSKDEDLTLSFVYQPVDHLNFNDDRLFRQVRNQTYNFRKNSNITTFIFFKYFWVDDRNYENGSPFFVFIMGQYDDPEYWLTQSHIREISDELNGAVFAVEPRYFGLSRPTELDLI